MVSVGSAGFQRTSTLPQHSEPVDGTSSRADAASSATASRRRLSSSRRSVRCPETSKASAVLVPAATDARAAAIPDCGSTSSDTSPTGLSSRRACATACATRTLASASRSHCSSEILDVPKSPAAVEERWSKATMSVTSRSAWGRCRGTPAASYSGSATVMPSSAPSACSAAPRAPANCPNLANRNSGAARSGASSRTSSSASGDSRRDPDSLNPPPMTILSRSTVSVNSASASASALTNWSHAVWAAASPPAARREISLASTTGADSFRIPRARA